MLGVAGLAGAALHPRLEIRELEKNADQWNVYLLGLRRFQSVDQSDKLSYYQVAGRSMSYNGTYMFQIPHRWSRLLVHLVPSASQSNRGVTC